MNLMASECSIVKIEWNVSVCPCPCSCFPFANDDEQRPQHQQQSESKPIGTVKVKYNNINILSSVIVGPKLTKSCASILIGTFQVIKFLTNPINKGLTSLVSPLSSKK